MDEKLERMADMMGDGCNTVNPAAYCDTSGADKVNTKLIKQIFDDQVIIVGGIIAIVIVLIYQLL